MNLAIVSAALVDIRIAADTPLRSRHTRSAIGIVRRLVRGALLAACSLYVAPALAWSNHALATGPALAAMPELAGLGPVKVESLESFLAAQ
ncbi:MAG: hypothetical protein OZ924_17815, partial [Burkholderiaceae bacterium]|nr:hypothetical protein [Burkholderiaceae bacterium]